MAAHSIDRAFLRIQHGLIHYRHCGRHGGAEHQDVPPLLLAHAGPGSSLGLTPLLAALGQDRLAIAPDMMGNGDSDPPPIRPTEIAFYADCAVRLLDGLGIERVDFYGSHTGAHVGLELAIAHPKRVRRVVLDGLPLFSAEEKADLLAHYAPEVTPNEFGGHLIWAWNFVRDQMLHFPYYKRDAAHAMRHTTMPAAAMLHLGAVDVVKALATFHLAYHAAFRHDVAARLPLLTAPTLLMAVETDPLSQYLDDVARLLPGAAKALIPRDARLSTIQQFLAAPDGV